MREPKTKPNTNARMRKGSDQSMETELRVQAFRQLAHDLAEAENSKPHAEQILRDIAEELDSADSENLTKGAGKLLRTIAEELDHDRQRMLDRLERELEIAARLLGTEKREMRVGMVRVGK